MAEHEIQPILTFFLVDQPSGLCKGTQLTILFFLAFWIPPALVSYVLGSKPIRQRLAKLCQIPIDKSMRSLVSIAGSMLIRFALENLLAATILRIKNSSNTFEHLFWIMALRPGPSLFVAVACLAEPITFGDNAREILLVECIMGLFQVRITNKLLRQLEPQSEWLYQHDLSQVQTVGLIRMRDGVKIATAMFSFTLLTALVCILVACFALCSTESFERYYKSILKVEFQDRHLAQFQISLSVLLNLPRTIANFVIWTAVPMLEAQTFCPSLISSYMLGLLCIISTILDHLWRGVFSAHQAKSDNKSLTEREQGVIV